MAGRPRGPVLPGAPGRPRADGLGVQPTSLADPQPDLPSQVVPLEKLLTVGQVRGAVWPLAGRRTSLGASVLSCKVVEAQPDRAGKGAVHACELPHWPHPPPLPGGLDSARPTTPQNPARPPGCRPASPRRPATSARQPLPTAGLQPRLSLSPRSCSQCCESASSLPSGPPPPPPETEADPCARTRPRLPRGKRAARQIVGAPPEQS